MLTVGEKSSRCTRCNLTVSESIPRLIEQILPRFEVTANATGVSTTSAIPCAFTFSHCGSEETGMLYLRYLPPEDQTPHDYAANVVSNDAPDAEAAVLFAADTELYLRADHADPLHIRGTAVFNLFTAAAAASDSTAYASLLSLPDGLSSGGIRVAFFQNDIYLEPRTLFLSPAEYSKQHPDIASAVLLSYGEVCGVYGENASERFTLAASAAEKGDLSAFDTDALVTYLVFTDAVRLSGAFGDNVLFVCTNDGLWYPLPLCAENALGILPKQPGLCPPSKEIDRADGTPFEAVRLAAVQSLSQQINACRSALTADILSPDSVADALYGALGTMPEEMCTGARNAATDAKLAKGGSTDEILTWYRSRCGL